MHAAKAKWDSLSTFKQVITGISAVLGAFVMIGGFMYAAYTHFMTAAEAAEQHQQLQQELHSYQKQQLDADRRNELRAAKKEKSDIEYRLLSTNLSEDKRLFLENAKQKQIDLINCLQIPTAICEP